MDVQFTIQVTQINIDINFPCQISLVWKTSLQKTASIQQYDIENGKSILNETLKLDIPLTQVKKSVIQVLIHMNDNIKVAGIHILYLADYLHQNFQPVKAKLDKCPDKNAQIIFNIKSELGFKKLNQEQNRQENIDDQQYENLNQKEFQNLSQEIDLGQSLNLLNQQEQNKDNEIKRLKEQNLQIQSQLDAQLKINNYLKQNQEHQKNIIKQEFNDIIQKKKEKIQNLKKQLKEIYDPQEAIKENNQLKIQIQNHQQNLLKANQKLGDLMNFILESNDHQLIDKLYQNN